MKQLDLDRLQSYKPTTENVTKRKELLNIARFRKLGAGFLVAAAIIAGASGCSSSNNFEIISKKTSDIKSIKIGPITDEKGTSYNARIRSYPGVENIDGGNLLAEVDETITIKLNEVHIYDDGTNGDWYGIPIEDYNASNSDNKINENKTTDGIIWVNNATVNIEYDDKDINSKGVYLNSDYTSSKGIYLKDDTNSEDFDLNK